ncbi:Pkinase-domain-containing protein [Basidiobolus meristosporus CBS 931.73]|uniref:Pkinase-domain-containing protein n=1 Tax=Basidiobolus meristosporus CBS 931.73 TaxID=1314790 RepID=A0A1Y1Z1Q5_9FUNG|nr:Pkinase-domain-containing protein [Basidiobolus meristosporus CBS 931.73]|eukprot:ORY04221.1 Pkinase-domain-containing protein [Basidiobolus meristosporus CBS 931.73]
MSLLHHPNIAKLTDIMIQPTHYYLFLEYINGGQLLDYIISHGKLKEEKAREFARQICSALDYCHKNSVVHRDLKIENILIDTDGSIKIIDFGLSNLYSPCSQLSTFCGSLYFAAPELLHSRAYTGPEIDIWSMGIVLYVLVCGRVPFEGANMPTLHAKIKKAHVEYPDWLSCECKSLLSRILVADPSERATMDEIIQHPWMNIDYESPVESHVPQRKPLASPLDGDVIKRMAGFEFGGEESIRAQLEGVLESEAYKEQHDHFRHPLLSIYYLVQEKMDREKVQAPVVVPQSQHLTPPPAEKRKDSIRKIKKSFSGNTMEFSSTSALITNRRHPTRVQFRESLSSHQPSPPTRNGKVW